VPVFGERETGKEKVEMMESAGRMIIVFGLVLVVIGVLLTFSGKVPWFGRLPGDIYIQKKGFSLYFPLTTSIIVSIVLSAILMLLRKR
jgi:uncharacterized membrane protein